MWELSNFIFMLGLVDLPLEGDVFTWSNNHSNPSMSRINRFLALQKKLLLAMARVRRNNTKSHRRLVLPTVKGRRRPSKKALLVILYYQRDRCEHSFLIAQLCCKYLIIAVIDSTSYEEVG